MITDEIIPYTTLESFYADENHILNEFFPSNSYINFGYYSHKIDVTHKVTIEERVASQAALYDYLFHVLNPQASDVILEVGCGRGDGCARLVNTYTISSIVGVDLFPEQISRALLKHSTLLKKKDNISFQVGAAEKLPFSKNSFSKIYSVEAAQHFQSLDEFASECWRILQPSGNIVLTTFFALNNSALQNLKKLMPHNIGTVDKVKPIEEVINIFKKAGFKSTQIEKIGCSVFPFFDLWLSQQKTQDWARLWAKAWREGLLEYYVLNFEK
jgi:ubiquinone/menaquinone biosynthesis C-methylase UbiE